MAINCVDRPEPSRLEVYQQDAVEFGRESPHFGPLIAMGLLPCAFWPVPAVTRPAEVSAEGAAPILVIGTTRDPATPFSWSRNLARQLDSGVLLRFNGDGHTVWGTGQSSCVDAIGNAYLINLRVPKTGAAC
jgi:pimeloyl-ACP methyl ester carboxylesterase